MHNMDDTRNGDAWQVERLDLLASLDREWIKLPLTIMQDVGPAVQTLGGLLKITNRETFVPVAQIAAKARLPLPTVRKHLITLDAKGWIHNRGRECTRRGNLRRTTTVVITKKTKDQLEPYGFLPWWACCEIRNVGKLPWCAKAVFSVLMARLCGLKATFDPEALCACIGNKLAAEGEDRDGPDEDFAAMIENVGGDQRFEFSLDRLVRQTGLSRDSVVTAKRFLCRHGVVEWEGNTPKPGQNTDVDRLVPNWAFRVVVTPASPGKCFLGFGVGSKSGQ